MHLQKKLVQLICQGECNYQTLILCLVSDRKQDRKVLPVFRCLPFRKSEGEVSCKLCYFIVFFLDTCLNSIFLHFQNEVAKNLGKTEIWRWVIFGFLNLFPPVSSHHVHGKTTPTLIYFWSAVCQTVYNFCNAFLGNRE